MSVRPPPARPPANLLTVTSCVFADARMLGLSSMPRIITTFNDTREGLIHGKDGIGECHFVVESGSDLASSLVSDWVKMSR